MADPIFDHTDRPGSPKLPPELVGKSPEEIAAYYQRREEILLERSRRPQAPPPAPKAADPEEKIDLFGDPTGSINRVVDRKVGERADRAVSVIAPAVINACKVTLRDAHPDAAKFMDQIETAMSKMSPESQMNPDYWEVAYYNIKGRNSERLTNEALEADRKSRNPVEKPTPKGTDPEKPRELSDMEKLVANKFDMTETEYRDAVTRYESTDGSLPMTYNNKRRVKPTAPKAS